MNTFTCAELYLAPCIISGRTEDTKQIFSLQNAESLIEVEIPRAHSAYCLTPLLPLSWVAGIVFSEVASDRDRLLSGASDKCQLPITTRLICFYPSLVLIVT